MILRWKASNKSFQKLSYPINSLSARSIEIPTLLKGLRPIAGFPITCNDFCKGFSI